jgi:hypothetical protein
MEGLPIGRAVAAAVVDRFIVATTYYEHIGGDGAAVVAPGQSQRVKQTCNLRRGHLWAIVSVIAFHEKAGRSQVGSSLISIHRQGFSLPS